MSKTRLLLLVLAAIAAVALLAGCGDSGGGDSSSDPASVAPPATPVFIEGRIQPTGELKANLEAIASKVAGVDDLGGTIVSLVEEKAAEAEKPFEYSKDVQPWLGETAGMFLTEFDGEDFDGSGIAIEVTDTGEAEDFLDKYVDEDEGDLEEKSYEGVDYKVSDDEGSVGVIGNFVVYGEDPEIFEAAVDASEGDALADSDTYADITPSSPESSLADVYVDIGGLIKEAGSEVDPDAKRLLDASGVDIENSSALISLVPGSDNVEIDVAAKAAGAEDSVPTEDGGALLGAMPASSIAAIGVGDFGANVGEAIDTIDEQGFPGEVPPNQLKDVMKKAGIDIDRIADNLGDAAAFAQGRTRATLGGALVIEAKDSNEARNTVSNIGTLLRANGTPGVSAIGGKASGFSVRSADLGGQPVVVAAKGERIAVGYGLRATLAGLESGSGATLAKTKTYNEALDSLGGTPISGFAAGRPALRLVEGLLSDTDEKEELEELTPYLSKVPFLAIGSEAKGDVVQLKLILGVTE